MRIIILCLFVLSWMSGRSYGQMAALDSDPPGNVPSSPLLLYQAATKSDQNLYNGRAYYIYDAREEEFQFYVDRKFEKGTVFYDGQRYDSIPMMYDLVRDELIIKHANGFENIVLQSPKVRYFDFYGHKYFWLVAGKQIDPNMTTGFYDHVYEGKSRVLVRRTKQRQERILEKKVIAQFPASTSYYVYANGLYHNISSKRALFSLFPEKKSELRKALREQGIKFRKNRERAIITMVARYDDLTK